MEKDERQLHIESIMHHVYEGQLELDKFRRDEANDRAVARCLARGDVMTAELREDGSILCTGYNGRQIIRMAGWRGR